VNSLALVAALALASLGSGCFSVRVGRADLAAAGVKHDKPTLGIVASVAPLENLANDSDVNADTVFALSKSWLTVLDESHLFKNVYTTAEAPDADVRFEGSVKKVSIYQNYWYITAWILGCGYFTAIIALLGFPYCTENGDIRLDIKAIDGRTGAIIARYETEWDETLIYNIWSQKDAMETFYAKPKKAVQEVCSKGVQALLADYAKYEAIARAKTPAPPAPPVSSASTSANPSTSPTGADPPKPAQ
jgi:hypothetical protein